MAPLCCGCDGAECWSEPLDPAFAGTGRLGSATPTSGCTGSQAGHALAWLQVRGNQAEHNTYANDYLHFKAKNQYLKKIQPSRPEGPRRQHQFSLADQARM